MYADVAYFGHGYYGIDAASAGYFHTSPDQLDWSQAALLAGLVQAPAAYDPLRHPARAEKRRAYVLRRLQATGILSRAQVRRYLRTPLGLTSTAADASASAAVHPTVHSAHFARLRRTPAHR